MQPNEIQTFFSQWNKNILNIFALALSLILSYIFPLVKYNWAHWSYNIHSSMVVLDFLFSSSTGHHQFKRSKQYITLHTRLLSLFNVYRDFSQSLSLSFSISLSQSRPSIFGYIYTILYFGNSGLLMCVWYFQFLCVQWVFPCFRLVRHIFALSKQNSCLYESLGAKYI